MNKKVLVSVLVPIYNVEKYIERCALSLFNQTYNDLEFIFVDDCTSDSSLEILNSIIAQFSHLRNSIKIIRHEENRGLAEARNTAIKYASGDFIIHVDSDDYLELNTIELSVKKQKEKNADIVSFGCLREYKSYTIRQIPPHYKDSFQMCVSLLQKKVNVGIWGRLIRRSLYIDNNVKVKRGCNMGEDFQVTPILAYYAKTVDVLEEALYHYDCTNESAYTSFFSVDKSNQCWQSYKVVELFFKNKGDVYYNAIQRTKTVFLCNEILKCSAINDKLFFYELKLRLHNVPAEYKKNVPITLIPPLYINSLKFLNLYYKCAKFIISKLKNVYYN